MGNTDSNIYKYESTAAGLHNQNNKSELCHA